MKTTRISTQVANVPRSFGGEIEHRLDRAVCRLQVRSGAEAGVAMCQIPEMPPTKASSGCMRGDRAAVRGVA